MTRLVQLDVLRGVSCLLVLISHLREIPSLRFIPDVGPTGVGLFFAISGFLITSGLMENSNLREFYNRRICRILPVYFLTLIAIGVFWPRPEVGWAATFCFNWLFISGPRPYFHTDATMAPVGHFWSVCVEEHFYLLWPLLVAYCHRSVVKVIPVIIVIATPFVSMQMHHWLVLHGVKSSDAADFLSRWTFTNLVAISIGALAGLHRPWILEKDRVFVIQIPRSVICGASLLAVLVIAMAVHECRFAYWLRIPSSYSAMIHHCFCGSLFLVALGVPSLGRLPFLASIGTISYGLYLFHLPIYYGFGLIGNSSSHNLLSISSALLATFALSWLSWRWIETPAISVGRQSLGRHWLGIAVSGGIVLSAISMVVWSQQQVQPRERFRSLADEIDTIVVGSSHAFTSIRSPIMPGVVYNCGSNMQSIVTSCQIARLAKANCSQLKRVICVLSPISFESAPEGDVEFAFHGFDAGSKNHNHACVSSHCIRVIWDRRHVPAILMTGSYFPDYPCRGWNPFPAERFVSNGERTAPAHDRCRVPSSFAGNVRLLTNWIFECQENEIQVDLVAPPVHHSFVRHFSSAGWNAFTRGAEMVRAETGLRLHDYMNDSRFDENDFFDCNHLNMNGAAKFTRILMSDLKFD